MNNNIILHMEIVNENITKREIHPISIIMTREIKNWSKKCYFQKHYFNRLDYGDYKTKRDNKLKCHYIVVDMLTKNNKISNFDAVNFIREDHLEKKRLDKKIAELNYKIYDVTTSCFFPKKNKHGNFTTAKYKNKEFLF